MTVEPMTRTRSDVLERIAERAFAQMVAMIHRANHRPNARPGDPKVGGHAAACASSLHVLGALHLSVRGVHDYVCCKPHAAPMDHAFHHLLGLFRRHEDCVWYSEEESKALMDRLRMFPDSAEEPTFQSYHARSDPDSFHFLPSGSVGIPPVVSVYLALAHRYAADHGYRVPPQAHFWSLIGDSEFREGSLLEAMPDVAERHLGNVTWIVDYNRQNLDGTRMPNEHGLHSRDCDRIERTAEANGWNVIQVRHGPKRRALFRKKGGKALREYFENELSDYAFQLLLYRRDAEAIRDYFSERVPEARAMLQRLDGAELLDAFQDLGGHDMEQLVSALARSKEDPRKPCLVVVHTVKGWGMSCFADPSNHSTLPRDEELEEILARAGLSSDDPYALFDEESDEGAWIAERREAFRSGIEAHHELRLENRRWAKGRVEKAGWLPDTLGVDLSLYPRVHTQWMWGQLAAKVVRIGTKPGANPEGAAIQERPLDENEERWASAADFVLTLSPDVGTSTNIAPILDKRIYGPDSNAEERDQEWRARHPELHAHESAWTRHIRFEIAEANCMSAVGAFGKMAHYVGLPFFPIMTVYDFFIKRALDQLYYNLYWGAEFVIVGTPSGVTLSSEGAQHSWKSDIQIPNLITWEPAFGVEMDWILSDAIKRQMEDRNEGRRGVLIRAVTRAIPQGALLDNVRRQAASKRDLPEGALLEPAGAGGEWGDAVDESALEPIDDETLLARVREDCLAGAYHLVDWRGYAGYEPGDNVVNVFVMGSLVVEALEAAETLLALGIHANVIAVSSPELLTGILAHADGYRHLRERLGVTGDLHATDGAGRSEAGLLSLAARRVPCVAVCDGEAGLLDNIGSIVGVRQITLAVRKFSKCGRPDQIFGYHGIDATTIVEACGRALSETALENLEVSPALLERVAGRSARPRVDWRELWRPGAADGG